MTLGAGYFKRIYEDIDRMKILSGSDREIIRKGYVSIERGNLSDRQVKQIYQVLHKLEKDSDYILPK